MSNSAHTSESTLIDSKSIRLSIQNIHPGENVNIEHYSVQPTGEPCGYLGEHYKIQIKYSINEDVHTKQLFLKVFPTKNSERIKYIEKHGFFRRELLFYDNIQKQFKQFSDDQQWCPKCYLAIDEKLVFEDLDLRGFQMIKSVTSMDESHIFRVMESFARLHSSSIILEETKRNKNGSYRLQDEFGEDLNKGHYNENVSFLKTLNDSLAIAGESKKYGSNTIHYDQVKTNWCRIEQAIIKFMKASKTYRNVIVHLDLWINNIMFKYDDNGNPTQCIFVDFQMTNICPPASDIAGFLYLLLDKNQIDACYKTYLEYYYTQLKNVLKQNKINVEDALPRSEFDKSFEEYRVWGLILSVMSFQFFVRSNDELKAIMMDPEAFNTLMYKSQSEYLLNAVRSNQRFENKIITLLDDLIDRLILCENIII